jgi:hypothetical protein
LNDELITVSARHLLLGHQDIENTDLIRKVLKLRQQENLGVALEMAVVSEAILMDDSFAFSWHSNLVGACITAGIDRAKAEKMAIQFMWLLFAKKGDGIAYAPMAYTQNPVYKKDIDDWLNSSDDRKVFKIELDSDVPPAVRQEQILKGIADMLVFANLMAEIKESGRSKDIGIIAQEVGSVYGGPFIYIDEGANITDDVKVALKRLPIMSCIKTNDGRLAVGFLGHFSDEEHAILINANAFEYRGAVRIRGGSAADYSDQYMLEEISSINTATTEITATRNSVIVFTIYP